MALRVTRCGRSAPRSRLAAAPTPLPEARADRGARSACWRRWRTAPPRAAARAGAGGRRRRRRGARHGARPGCWCPRRCRRARRSPRPTRTIPARRCPAQQAAAGGAARARWRRAHSRVTLLDGVTGSGKTEVYFEAVAECLRAGPAGAGAAAGDRAVLAVAGAVRARASAWRRRSGTPTSPRARGGSPGGRWRQGAAPVVVGARSALFLPFPDLGLVVVDEEHETAFKQEDGVVYHARDMAVVRARLCGAPAVLVSPRRAWRRWPTSRPAATAALHLPTPAWRRGAADGRGDRPARDAAGARPLPGAAAGRGGAARRWRAASRRCCSSTAAAMRR